jgi:hypothetical protein
MTAENTRLIDKLLTLFFTHRGSHGCGIGYDDRIGPHLCNEAARLYEFIGSLEAGCRDKPTPCALCGRDTQVSDRLPRRDGGTVHFSCAAQAELARTGAPRVGVAVGQRMGGARVLTLVGGGRS